MESFHEYVDVLMLYEAGFLSHSMRHKDIDEVLLCYISQNEIPPLKTALMSFL